MSQTRWANVCRLTALVTLGALGAVGGAVAGCASVRPTLETARRDFVQACSTLASVIAGDAEPSKAEQIAERVCLAERVAEQVEREIVSAERDIVRPFPGPDAGAR